MAIRETIEADLKSSMKNADQHMVGILRLLLSAIHNEEIAKRGRGEEPALTFEEGIVVLKRESKKRRESALLYRQGGRTDLAEQEEWEFKAIQKYLPAELSKEEIEKVVVGIIASGEKEFGKIIREAMRELKGRADGKLVSEVIKASLANQ